MRPLLPRIGCLLLAAAWITAGSAQVRSGAPRKPPDADTNLQPEVVLSGASTPRIRLDRNVFKGVHSVRITACDSQAVSLDVHAGAQPIVTLPAAALAQPCILRLAPADNPDTSYPLAVADPHLASLPLPPYDHDVIDSWSGMFNRFYGDDDWPALEVPSGTVLVGIFIHEDKPRKFVLGKGNVAVLYLKAVPSPSTRRNHEDFFYLPLPGVHDEDVRWGPNDVEGFWIGVVSEDGKKILEWLPLSDMVEEPSGPLDH